MNSALVRFQREQLDAWYSMHGGGSIRGCSRSSCSIRPFDSSIRGCSRLSSSIRGYSRTICSRASVDLQHVRRVAARPASSSELQHSPPLSSELKGALLPSTPLSFERRTGSAIVPRRSIRLPFIVCALLEGLRTTLLLREVLAPLLTKTVKKTA
ncbi:unnamed protein product [Victoria cruziana]